jgi:hypothetical protein
MYTTVRKYIIMSKKMKVISLKKISSTELSTKIERGISRRVTPSLQPPCETLIIIKLLMISD